MTAIADITGDHLYTVSCCVLSLSHVPVVSPACTLHQWNCYSSITCQQVCTALKQLLSAF